ncbi:unnamed protein product [Heterotrigona itama]|uniref:Uncharacterized protein n=1 Tax=Heterotrigona itama TaxID=395501 RepID=A0A6V7H4M0_9HYME|nr:unnamed protein product [Heterotrigona itama]
MVEDSRWIVRERTRPQPRVQEGTTGDARKKDSRSERGEKDGRHRGERFARRRRETLGRKRGWAGEKRIGEKCDIDVHQPLDSSRVLVDTFAFSSPWVPEGRILPLKLFLRCSILAFAKMAAVW